MTANTKYAGKYEVTVTEVSVGKEYKVHAKRVTTGGTPVSYTHLESVEIFIGV